MSDATKQLLENLNALAAGLFLLTAFGIVAMRQARACLNLFIVQSLLLAASAALLGLRYDSGHLYGVALVNLISKPIIVPWLLRKTSSAEIYTRREIDQVLEYPDCAAHRAGAGDRSLFCRHSAGQCRRAGVSRPERADRHRRAAARRVHPHGAARGVVVAHRAVGHGERRVPRRHFHRARSWDAGRACHRHGWPGHRVHHGRTRPCRAEADRHHGGGRIGESEGDGGRRRQTRRCRERHRHPAAAAGCCPAGVYSIGEALGTGRDGRGKSG